MAAAAAVPVGLFLSSFESDATARQIAELIGRLDRSCFEIHVACIQRANDCLARIEHAAASVTEFRIDGVAVQSTAAAIVRFVKWCRAHRLTLVHTCDLHANVYGLIGAALAKIPVRIASRTDAADSPGIATAVQRLASRYAHRIITTSDTLAERLVTERVPYDRICVIPNGIDLSTRRLARHRARRRNVMVTELRTARAQRVMVEAAALLLERYGDLRFQLAGYGPHDAGLRAFARARRVSHAVTFADAQDLSTLIAASDIFVVPSRSEPLLDTLLEAMASGLPVVAPRVGGPRDPLDHGRTGLVVRSDDARGFADAIASLVDQPDRGMALGRAARRHVESRYSFDHMAARVGHVYLTELAARGIATRTYRSDEAQPPRPAEFVSDQSGAARAL